MGIKAKQFLPGEAGQSVRTVAGPAADWDANTRNILLTTNDLVSSTTNGANGPTQTEYGGQTDDSLRNITSYDFSDSVKQFIETQIIMPRDYDGGDIRFRTLWIDNSALGTGGGTGGGVTWALEARSIDDGDNIDVPWNTPIIVNDDSNGLDKLNISSQSDLITPGGSPAANKPLSLRLSRDVDDAGDDLNKSVSLIGIQIQYVVE